MFSPLSSWRWLVSWRCACWHLPFSPVTLVTISLREVSLRTSRERRVGPMFGKDSQVLLITRLLRATSRWARLPPLPRALLMRGHLSRELKLATCPVRIARSLVSHWPTKPRQIHRSSREFRVLLHRDLGPAWASLQQTASFPRRRMRTQATPTPCHQHPSSDLQR